MMPWRNHPTTSRRPLSPAGEAFRIESQKSQGEGPGVRRPSFVPPFAPARPSGPLSPAGEAFRIESQASQGSGPGVRAPSPVVDIDNEAAARAAARAAAARAAARGAGSIVDLDNEAAARAAARAAAGTPVLPDTEYVGTPYRAPVPGAPPTPDPTPDPTPPPTPPPGPAGGSTANWQQLFDEQRAAAERSRQNLNREYETRRNELRSQYQLTETDEERAQLAFLMAELDAATQRADEAIAAGYANAVQNIQTLGVRAGSAADAEAQAIQQMFLTSGERFGGMVEDVRQQTGLQAGLAGTAFGPAEDFMGLLSSDAAREAALSQRMGGIISEEMTDAERRMAFQQASQQGDLQRQAASSGAQTRADQQAAVANRIAQERRDLANNVRQLQSTYATLGASFDQAEIASFGEQAALSQAESLFLQNIASQERTAAANRAAQMSQLEAQWAREDDSRPDWQTDELAAASFRWGQMTDLDKSRPGAFENVFGGLIPGVESRGAPSLPGRPDPSSPGESPTGPQPKPLVEITDEEFEAEAARRAARGQAAASRQQIEDSYRTRKAWEDANLIPEGTADIQRQQDIEKHEAQYGPW